MTPTAPELEYAQATASESDVPPLFPGRAGPDDGAGRLRLRLAVRGWARPLDLIDAGHSPEQIRSILGALAAEVETAVQTRPNQWYLSLAARKRELARRDDAQLRSAASARFPGDGDDPVLKAMQIALADAAPALSSLDADVLAALGNACDWLGERWRHAVGAQRIAGELASKALDADLQRMTRDPMVGRSHRDTLARLIGFATAATPPPLSVAYVYGGGGAGKTTLLSFLQRDLSQRTDPVPVVRIDFDEPAIDPTRMVTLNIALVEQLALSVPAVRDRASDMLPALRDTALVQRDAGLSRGGPRKRIKSSRPDSMLKAESVASQAASDEGSILYRLLAPDRVTGPILIVFDTAELVLAQSDHVASSLVSWLGFLHSEAGARDLRLVIAGRDPPGDQDLGYAASNLLSRLKDAGARIETPIGLPELDQAEAQQLLRNCGVDDPTAAAEAAAAVPGNPLLLRITADALLQGGAELRESVRRAHRDSRIDADSARNYLLRRVVAHVRDPIARPYVLAATYSPAITAKLLEEAIIPAVDRNERASGPGKPADAKAASAKAKRVFDALASTYWLTRQTLRSETVPFNREIRAFALKLLAATPEGALLERDVRQSAAIHHLRRRSAGDRALALYHLALLGHPYTVPRDLVSVQTVLRDVIEELPADLRNRLAPPVDNVAPGVARSRSDDMGDSDWRRYLEGDERSKRAGEGAQMVKADLAREALDLYLARPTRPPGLPPTFVIQAQADLGEWDEGITDIDAILEREADDWLARKSIGPEALSRIYWITRLALQAHGRLSTHHAMLLRNVSETAAGPGLSTLPALIAVAETMRGEPIMAGRMRSQALKTEAAGRTLLSPIHGPLPETIEFFDASIAVVQSDWRQRMIQLAPATLIRANAAHLRDLQSRIDALHAKPIAQVNQLFNKMRTRIPVEPSTVSGLNSATLLFRGLTPEFYRPLREALLALCENGVASPMMRQAAIPIFDHMSIRPAEMEPATFYRRLSSNPNAWCTAFIVHADRCRLLPGLCEFLARFAENPKSRRIASSFLAWDKALCRGTTSDWGQPATPRK
ncbi:hypothetical protein [Lysobacter enzymogenes]|uniref:Orc1-like AAA ATPase domain-containing protein n=1 Tax=Lysobacter enzymogenes TaxID=69 RepID=A0A3N2RKX9_LYSEN|nr:hypothetical protein [Lysobacter enzymogenes]ROU08130.1 hypothetical protein D9T17_05670 [Lysobacter enzymogenes]